MPTIRVALVEDQRATREGLVALIGNAPGFEVVAQFSSMEKAIGAMAKGPPDVLLADIGLPASPEWKEFAGFISAFRNFPC